MQTPKRRLAAWLLAAALGSGPLLAQTTVTYNSGDATNTPRTTTSANPLTVTLATGAATESGVISGDGSLTKTGTGLLTLNGANTYTGTTLVNAGTLALGATGTLNSGTFLNVASGAMFDFSLAPSVTVSGLTGTGTVKTNGGGITVSPGSGASSTFTGSITGNGRLIKDGTGTLILSNTTNNYLGATVLNGGTLQFSQLSDLGQARFRFAATGGTLRWAAGNTADLSARQVTFEGTAVATFDTNGNNVTFANAIGFDNPGTGPGTGSLVKTGAGLLTLLGNNPYTGNTTIVSGGLQLGNGGTTGSLAGNVSIGNGATLIFNRSDNVTYSGRISGQNSVQQIGSGILTLAGDNSGFGGIFLADGTTITMGHQNALGLGAIQLSHAGKLDATTYGLDLGRVFSDGTGRVSGSGAFTLTGPTHFNANLEGTASLTKSGTDTAILSGTNTHTGGTTVSGGTLQLGNGGTSGSVAGNVTVNSGATLGFNRSDSTTYAGIVSGAGSLAKSGSGTVTLSGANTYTGTTFVNAGTLALGATGTLNSLAALNVATGATFDFSLAPNVTVSALSGTGTVRTNGGGIIVSPGAGASSTFTGSITGNGRLIKDGTGTLILSNTTNNYLGATVLNGGTLEFSQLSDLGQARFRFAATGGTLRWAAGNTADLSARQVTFEGTAVATFDTNGNNVTFANAIGFDNPGTGPGTGSLVKTGAGLLTLLGNNTYTGGTTVSQGGLQIGTTNGTTGSLAGNISIAANADLVSKRNGNFTLAGNISGSGRLTQSGGNILTLAGDNNAFTGAIRVNSGTIAMGHQNALGSGLIEINGGNLDTSTYGLDLGRLSAVTTGNVVGSGAFTAANAADTNLSLYLGGSGSLTKSGAGRLSLQGATYSGTTTINEGILQLGDGVSNGGFGSSSTSLAAATALEFNSTNIDYEASGTIAGSGSVIKSGGNTLTLRGANSYTGTTTVNAGTLVMGNAAAIGSGAITIASGATLDTGNAVNFDLARLTNNGGTGTLTGNSWRYVNFIPGNATVTNNLVSGGTLLREGATNHTLTLAGTLDLSGLVQVNSGILAVGSSAHGSIHDGQLTVLDTLDFSAAPTDFTVSTKYVSGSGTIRTNATLLNFDADPDNFTHTFNGTITGAGGVQKNGPDKLILAGNNTYTGQTIVTGGTLQVGNGGTKGTISGSTRVDAGATLAFQLQDGVHAGNISGAGQLVQTSGILSLTGDATHTGGTSINSGANLKIGTGGTSGSLTGNVANAGVLTFNRSDAVTFAGKVSGTGGLTKQGAGTLTLTAGNTYTGGTDIQGGTLRLGQAGALGSASVITVGSGATLDTDAYGLDLSRLANVGTGSVTGSGSFTYDSTATRTVTASLAGAGALAKSGTGTLTLTGTNTHTGGTTVSAGTLQVGDGGTNGSISGTITNDAALVFKRSDAATFSGNITGTGSVTQAGTGTTVLTGDLSHTGGTTVSAGTLQIGNGGNIGWLAGDITNNAALAFNLSNNATFSDVISGTGSLTKNGAGSLILTGENTYTGGTTISAGTLQIGAWSLPDPVGGSVVGNIANNSHLIFRSSFDQALAGDISGSGDLFLVSFGQLTLTGHNTYTGGTKVFMGTLQVGDGGTTGSLSGNVEIDETLAFKRSDTVTFAGDTTGFGELRQIGTGTLVYTGNATHTGGTSISAGTLQIGDGITDGSVSGDIMNDSVLNFTNFGPSTYTGVIYGGGRLVKAGPGTLTLTGTNTYSGGTTVSAGRLAVGNGGTTGSISGNITDNALVEFNRSNDLAYAGDITGSGGLIKRGNNTLTLTGTNTYSGGTDILSGTLQVGNGGTSGSISGNIANSASLAFKRSDAVTYAGTISGAGSVAQRGTGSLTLTGDNTYTGNTLVSAGTLVMGHANSLGSGTITVGTQGTLNAGAFGLDLGRLDSAGDGTLTSSGGFVYNSGASATVNATLSGRSTLTKLGAGTLILTGANTYIDGTIVAAGTLQIGDGGTSGSVDGRIFNDASLIFNRSDAITVGNQLDGSGALTQAGTGSTRLTANNQYTGGTIVQNGTLTVAGFGWLGTGGVTINTPGTLSFDGTVNQRAPQLAGNGRVRVVSGNMLFETDNSAFSGRFDVGLNSTLAFTHLGLGNGTLSLSGGTAVLGAGLQFDLTRLADGSTGVLSAYEPLTYSSANNRTFDVNFVTHQGFNKSGDATLIFNGTVDYLNVSGGTVQIGSGGTTGSITGDIVNNAAVVFKRADTTTYAGNILGNGTVTQAGSGTLIFTGNANFGIETNVTAGTLQIGNGGTSGSVLGNITNNASVVFRHSGTNTFFSTLSGTGSVTQAGPGSLELSGMNTYTGGTTVDSGTLLANNLSGSATGYGSVTVNSGATLGGSGFIAGITTLNSGAHLAPGNSPGTLTFTNGLTLGNGSILDFQLGTASDLIRVTGGTLTGATSTGSITLNLSNSGGFTPATYTLFDFTGANLNNFDAADFTIGAAPAGYTYNLAIVGQTLQLNATSAVPEPATCAALAGAAALGLAAWRRRSNKR